MSLPANSFRRLAAALAGCLLLLAGCGGGENKPMLADTLQASFSQDPPPASGAVVFFDDVTVVGDTIQMDVVVRDDTGALQLDDVDLVIRYDASFIQITSISGQNTLFGTCNTVNPVCAVNSPICIDNLPQANGGGERYCRTDGSTSCATDDDCPAAGDVCGSFGRLEAAFVVLTGPKACSNNPAVSCTASSECQLCGANPAVSCTGPGDCSGGCGTDNHCINLPGRSCVSDGDCFDACVFGTCQGCPAVAVSGTRKLASLVLRVRKEGASPFRFVVSSSPGTTASAARKDLVDQPVLFFPNVDGDDPTVITGGIVIAGRL